ncbi:MAG TPA: ATP-binding cassette domain-containing protein [Chthoniobacteraceae bacterium]|jgi:ATP-binding cassette subfamily F protein uup|nr:ATP-binding cassette domain-containing protein [Chthoniobacteraceae bacterium]
MADSFSTAIVSASELVVRYGPQTVLDRATLTIHEGERVGLVGRNGCGKSTFLRIAASALEPDGGQFTRRRDLVTGYLPQIFDLDEARSVHANILVGAQHILGLIAEYESAAANSARSGQLLGQIEHFDGWNLEHRIRSLITNLHAPDAERLVGTLSGGEKRRVALCRALLARPDFLILDEPTNHLDTGSIEWLEDFLARYPGACLFVTHDRYFLDRIATRIVELARGQFLSFDGGYNDYLLAKAQRQSVEEEQERKRQKFLKKELEWVRRGPKARRTKSVDRIERYFEMAAQEVPEQEIDIELIIPPAPKTANRIIELRDVSLELGGRTLFDGLSLDLPAQARLGIIGRNGLGKSSLLKVILGQLAPTRGEVEIGPRTQINYVDQSRLLLDEGKTVWEEVGEGLEYVALGEERITLRGYLRRFLFTEERINTKIEQLSGGERSRILLAKILKRGGNVLILDEPTNDLDLATLRLLEEALTAFRGNVLVVSHDRYFLNRVCTHTLAFEGDGEVTFNIGNYDYYVEKRAERAAFESAFAASEPSKTLAPSTREKPRKLKWKEERELEGMEAAILAAEDEVVRLEALLAAPDFYAKHGSDWAAFEAQLKIARDTVAQLYARWEELEAIRSAGA